MTIKVEQKTGYERKARLRMKTSAQKNRDKAAAMKKLYGLCYPYNSTELAWKRYGQSIVTQHPPDEWPTLIEKIPAVYRESIRSRILKDYGVKKEL